MSDDRSQSPNAEEQRALSALRRLPRAEASAEARARTRAAFLAVAPPVAQARRRNRWIGLLAAAVLGVLAVVMMGRQPTAEWVVLDVVDPAQIATPGGPPAVGDVVTAGPIATAAGAELELQLGDQLRLRLRPESELDLPSAPGRWFDRTRRLDLHAGEVYGTTGGQSLTFDLSFATGELQAGLTGTTFAVFRTDEASCVCLWEGGIRVHPLAGGPTVDLVPGQRVWIYKDGRPPEILPLSDMETMKLQMMQEAGVADVGP